MSKPNRDRKKSQRRLKRKLKQGERERAPIAQTKASVVTPDIHREIRYITQCAQAEDSRIVKIGNLVLFSTRTRDAWLLDFEDDFAMCVCRDGEPQPIRILDTPDTFAIDWPAKFAIDGEIFNVQERSGRVVAITGYPTIEISAARLGASTSRDSQLKLRPTNID